MSDTRTLREKLEAMASQDVSPHEAAIAQAKLAEMGGGHREPPRTIVAAPAPEPSRYSRYSTTTTTGGSFSGNFSGNFRVTFGPTS